MNEKNKNEYSHKKEDIQAHVSMTRESTKQEPTNFREALGDSMPKVYDPKTLEYWYEQWEKAGIFSPKEDDLSSKGQKTPTFTLVMPPPNVTGVLHMGHALNNIVQDILVRYQRMQGFRVLWIPGTDHAGIATQTVMEKKLAQDNKTKQELGYNQFIQQTWELVEQHQKVISQQLKKLGCSCDWDHSYFTLAPEFSQAVQKVFVHLYEQGYIYRDYYIVNWDSSIQTAISDEEVEYLPVQGYLYHLEYKVKDTAETLTIATTRPETIFGDVALAVHPDDERYQHLVGQKAWVPLIQRSIPIISDTMVEKEFGSGIVKITPAHDKNDWQVGQRHQLPIINILHPDGTLNDQVPAAYQGLSIIQAREKIIQELEQDNILIETKAYQHSVGYSQRTKTVVEPYASWQWFVKMKTLAQKALEDFEKGNLQFFPSRWANVYKHWLTNIQDWCISRQLWWGHALPVWQNRQTQQWMVSLSDPNETCEEDPLWIQSSDVLDTWFSSWLCPMASLGWPEKTSDMAQFYPNQALVTAYDIIFFWVARMVMAGLHFTGQAPFQQVYITSLLRDKQGRKLSKSLGNGEDPLELIDQWGCDALRFSMSYLCVPGQDIFFDRSSVAMGSKLVNKLWNAARFILSVPYTGEQAFDPCAYNEEGAFEKTQQWFWFDGFMAQMISEHIDKIHKAFQEYNFSQASHLAYNLFWDIFCDWYLELAKVPLYKGELAEKQNIQRNLRLFFSAILHIVHPFVPFVSEELHHRLGFSDLLAARTYPQWKVKAYFQKDVLMMNIFQNAVMMARALMSEMNWSQKDLQIYFYLDQNDHQQVDLFYHSGLYFEQMVHVKPTYLSEAQVKEQNFLLAHKKFLYFSENSLQMWVVLENQLDLEQAYVQLNKKIVKTQQFLDSLEKRLKDPRFLEKADEKTVKESQQKWDDQTQMLARWQKYQQQLQNNDG